MTDTTTTAPWPTPPAGYTACRTFHGPGADPNTQVTHLVQVDGHGRNSGRPTMCGLTRFETEGDDGWIEPTLASWSMGNGGVSGPNITQRRCEDCWQATGGLSAVATRYEFLPSSFFEGDPMDHAIAAERLWPVITVAWRGGGRWAICRGQSSPQFVWCERDSTWEYEPLPSSREDDFFARTRYTLDEAIIIASRLAEPPRG